MDVTVTLTSLQAMQVQTALGNRITALYEARGKAPAGFEAEVMSAAIRLSDEALVLLLDAMYPPESADELTAAKAVEDNARGDHFVYPA